MKCFSLINDEILQWKLKQQGKRLTNSHKKVFGGGGWWGMGVYKDQIDNITQKYQWQCKASSNRAQGWSIGNLQQQCAVRAQANDKVLSP